MALDRGSRKKLEIPTPISHMGFSVVFELGKQRDFLYEVKKQEKISWRDLAEKYEIHHNSLWDWRTERYHLPEMVYQQMRKDDSFEQFIIERRPAKGRHKNLRMPKKSAALAELCGIIHGDGNITKKPASIRIAGDSNHEKEYLGTYVPSLFKELFGLDCTLRPSYNKDHNGIYCKTNSADLVEYFEHLGMKAGNKMTNGIDIPIWILQNEMFLRRYLRGLIDTDGSIFLMSQRDDTLLRIQFTSHHPPFLWCVREAFRRLGFHPNKPTNNHFNISRQNEIRKFLKEIGFANSKHQKRLEQFTAP